MLWVLNGSDGNHALLDIAERSGLKFEDLQEAAVLLAVNGLTILITANKWRN
jgi:aminopeptidase-like protein